jgi:uncharacterized protein (DUF1800 family)
MGEAQSGKSAEQVAAIIFSLDVVKAIYPTSMSNAAFVTAIYQNVFSRAPDTEGLNYWSAQLEGGLDRGALTLSMIRSGLNTPDGTPGKAMIVNRMDVARYAVARQQATGIEVAPDNLKLNFAMVSGVVSSVELARANIDVLVSISPQHAARFLLQAGFAASDSDIAAIQATNYSAWLDQELNRPIGETSWDWTMGQYTALGNVEPSFVSTVGWRLISAPDAVRQRVALALSEFFVVSAQGLDISFQGFALAAWWDLLCEHAFGNYRAMLGAITLSLPMGYYLNMLGNKKEDPATGRMPDENYAREILQLFSIGLYKLNLDGTPLLDGSGQPIETYTQSDVSNLARVFTGWTRSSSIPTSDPNFARQPMVFRSADHSTLSATFLGVTVSNTDGLVALERTLDVIFMHPNVGPFFGKSLIQRLVTSNPSPAYISRVAAAFNNNGSGVRGDMKAVIRAVLLDVEARTDANLQSPSFGKLREPFLRFVQWARTFRASSLDGHWRLYNLGYAGSNLNQQALYSPSVFNFFRPGYIPPNSVIAQQSLVAPEFQIVDEVSTANYLNTMQYIIQSGTGYPDGYPNQLPGAKPNLQPDYSVELTLASNASALLKHLNLKLCAGQMSPETELTIRDAINTIAVRTDTPANNEADLKKRIHAAIFLTMACPDYLIQT